MDDLNPFDLANTRYLVISDPEATIKYLSSKVKVIIWQAKENNNKMFQK